MSRYPSAYGHTPSYRSVGSMPVYPSALGARDTDLSFRSSGTSGLSADIDREFSAMKSAMKTDSLLSDPLLSTRSGAGGATSYKSSSYSATEMRSSADGGVPHRSTHSDSTYKSTTTGTSGIPHTSYSHTSSSFDSDRPYGNRSSTFSYNI
eukprot:TRINITY_DN24289_c0_g1_i1.p1 TRINITY_DN24289_c0_g1~~TRINITY_DN24289_c0_g1_i1.p1  ORF type:complete len:162 (-),score=25.75 TRINITY_DN24289_c0_g1_i1:316-768(-)